MEQQNGVESRSYIIHHNASSTRKSLQAAQRKRLDDIESSKEYKTCQKVFPIQGNTNQRDHLSCDLINHDEAWIFLAALAGDCGGRRDSD